MCGVAGVLAPGAARAQADVVAQMVEVQHHRGPDDSGLVVEDDVVLGHDRLSIQDLSPLAAQPMASADGRWLLSYNGEVYNVRELRRLLERRGVVPRSSGDTEVLVEVLALLEVDEVLPLLEGDWAFALWDRRDRRLVLARDRHGVKPMHWRVVDGAVRFASEARALVPDDPEPDRVVLESCLLGFSGTYGDRTAFAGVRSVEPGHALVFEAGALIAAAGTGDVTPEVRKYAAAPWLADDALRLELEHADDGVLLDRFDRAFTAGTERRLISDAPIACLASGGVDSSLIAAVASRTAPDLPLYHADVVGDSELDAASALARALGLELRVRTVAEEDVLDALPAVTLHNEVPLIYHLNSVPFYLVSELARGDGIKVLLTGEGSDEYFLGYPGYALAGTLAKVDRVKRVLRAALAAASGRAAAVLWPDPRRRYDALLGGLLSLHQADEVADLAREVVEARRPGAERRAAAMTMDLVQNHLLSLLHRNDRLGMAWSLESRFPFLDTDLARLAVNAPARAKLRVAPRVHDVRHPFVVDKWVVRQLAGRHVPPVLARRPKRGFKVSLAERLVVDPEWFAGGYLREVHGFTRAALARAADAEVAQWPTRLLLLDLWGRVHVLREEVDDVRERLRKHVALRP